MRPLLLALMLTGAVQLQLSAMPAAALDGAIPNLPLLVAVSACLLLGPEQAAWWALLMGWLLDWRSGSFAAYSLPLLSVVLLAGLGRRRVFTGGLALTAALTALGSLLHLGVQLLLAGRWAESGLWTPQLLAGIALRATLVNLLWLPVVFAPLRMLVRWLAPPSMGWER
ncbi:MAG TPA: rod shape-determining protein MreD [Anaerolineae bacterium]|nr:rod shape-determining protein MreD [Anaerolineae bacterium]